MVKAKRRGRPVGVKNKVVSIDRADDKQIGGSHYKEMGVQPWEAMESLLTFEEFIGFLKGNMIKYAMRQGLKDPHDADKFRHYRQKYLEMLILKPLD